MISKHIFCKPENDNYSRLAKYIADASHKGEKCILNWCVGCEGSDNDYIFAIKEVEDVQSLNYRSDKEKTYHLIVSFRIEDEGKLTNNDFIVIEERFAKALGFAEHQRHCGIHKNTDNLHLHIAYNMIHPEKHTRFEPFRDYKIRDSLCRELEHEYNLSIDNGITRDNSYKLSNNSASKEARTGEESFERYVLDRHEKIMQAIEKAEYWQDVHFAFADFGLEILQRANGLSIKNKKGRQSIKASKFDKEISYKKMFDKFGKYERMKFIYKAKEWYNKKPLEIDFSLELWKEFIQSNKSDEIKEIKEKWRKKKIKITGLAITKQREKELLKEAHIQQKLEINELRQNYKLKSENWLQFLQEKAQNGNEEALLVLRITSDKNLSKTIDLSAKKEYKKCLIDEKELLTFKEKIYSSSYSRITKRTLIAVEQFKKTIDRDFSYKITSSGAIIFELQSGGKVIDNGNQITCTQGLEDIAQKYKDIKLGKVYARQNSVELTR